jgi:hypothetical protein
MEKMLTIKSLYLKVVRTLEATSVRFQLLKIGVSVAIGTVLSSLKQAVKKALARND